MPDLKYLPISFSDHALLFPLMDEEEQSWLTELTWDYSPIHQILTSFMKQKLLPGYIAVNHQRAVGYSCFFVHQTKAIIAALYASKADYSQEVLEELLSLTISNLKDSQNIQRIEAQIMTFHNLNLAASFTQHGFQYYPRYFLELDLRKYRNQQIYPSSGKIVSWDSSYLPLLAEVALKSYHNQIDAVICEDYRTYAGCEGYLKSLIENPGCGIFVPEASFVVQDIQGIPCGFTMCSRISSSSGMISQIAIHPSHQGCSLGKSLIHKSFQHLKSLGFSTVSLTVTKKNRLAFEWYQRLGFRIRKEFGAYVWERFDR